jgi:hypothetical protein
MESNEGPVIASKIRPADGRAALDLVLRMPRLCKDAYKKILGAGKASDTRELVPTKRISGITPI